MAFLIKSFDVFLYHKAFFQKVRSTTVEEDPSIADKGKGKDDGEGAMMVDVWLVGHLHQMVNWLRRRRKMLELWHLVSTGPTGLLLAVF